MNIFGSSVQVIALIVAIVCIISAILGRSFGIGPVQINAPRELQPRAALAALGAVLLLVVIVTSNIGGKPLIVMVAEWFSPPSSPQFAPDNKAFRDLVLTDNVSPDRVRLQAEALYAEAWNARDRCLVVQEIADAFHDHVDAYPLGSLSDAEKYSQRSSDTRDMSACGDQLQRIAIISAAVRSHIVAAAPIAQTNNSTIAGKASRPTPLIQTNGVVSQATARRVLTAQTQPGDEGWIFIGFRNLREPVLIANQRVNAREIPRSGVVATIADTELLETNDPGLSLGTVRGYVPAGSAVQVLATSGPRHYTNGQWDGYDVYAKVVIESIPQSTVASSTPALLASPSASSTSASSGAPAPSPARAVTGTVGGCAGLPSPSATFFTYCGETYPIRFSDYTFRSYKVWDSHSTGIHFRNIGPHGVYLSIYPGCDASVSCPAVQNALLPPVLRADDASNDYIYTAQTLKALSYGWTIDITPH